MYVFAQNKHIISFMLVIVKWMNCLKLFSVIFEDVSKVLHYVHYFVTIVDDASRGF